MSMVERLAKKWDGKIDDGADSYVHETDARWWLNAIADELESQDGIDAWPYPGLSPTNVADHLRTQAKAGTE